MSKSQRSPLILPRVSGLSHAHRGGGVIVLPIEQNRSELVEAWLAAALSYSQRKSDGLPIDGTRSYLDSLMDEYLETVRGA